AENKCAIPRELGGVSSEDDHWHKATAGTHLPEPAQDLEPVWGRHVQVEQHDVGLELGESLLVLFGIGDAANHLGIFLEELFEYRDVVRIVVDFQHTRAHVLPSSTGGTRASSNGSVKGFSKRTTPGSRVPEAPSIGWA